MKEIGSRLYDVLSSMNEIKWNVALKGLLTGIISGMLVVLYRLGIEYGTETAVKFYAYLKLHPLVILPWIVLAVFVGLFIGWLVKQEPMATGSGIPQVEGVLLYGLKMKWYSVLIVRFIGGILASFFGLSLGREGPSIQIGAAGSKAVANRMSKNKLEENYLITGGAAAGLSAAFNAPLSGIIFALEEVHRSFSPILLMAVTTAALTADIVAKNFFGLKPVLSFATLPQLPENLYLWLIPLGIIGGLAGVLLNKSLLFFQNIFNKLPWFLRPCIALLLALPCGLFLPSVLGGGQNLIQMAQTANSGLVMLLIIVVVKLIFTSTSFGSGIPGGIFLPILSVGALAGCSLGVAAVNFGLIPSEYIPVFAVCAMAGALSGAVKAPVTSILLTAEMTGSFLHMLPVAACSFIALLLSDILKTSPIYEALLERIMQKKETKRSDKLGGLLEVPVELGSNIAGKMIKEVIWPQGTLIVGIRRGETEHVPCGNTIISPGDYLIVLTSDHTYKEIKLKITELCHTK